MSEYLVFYTEANLVCLIIFALMVAHDLLHADRQEKQVKYDRALLMFMLYFISDTFCAWIIAEALPKTRLSVVVVNFANYLLMAGITYTWLQYDMAVEQVPHRNRSINRFAVFFPFLVSTVALIAVYCIAPEVLLDKDLKVTPVYNVFLIAVPIINIIAAIIYSIRRARTEENPIEKQRHLYIGFFPLMVVAGGVFQIIVLPNTPIFCFSCALLMLILYIHSMEDRISIDALTKLNNRGQLIRYVSQRGNGYRKDRQTYVVMIDVNGFKKINDTYGHTEGDRALVLIANCLSEIVKRRSTSIFLSRYGGDEFVLIVPAESEDEIMSLIEEIRGLIEARCLEFKTPYMLSVGVGCARLEESPDSLQKCILRADEHLYLDKEHSRGSG
ncbi:MAG: GGDEF domain-containing protein [Ruminococcus sp.]|nr:GGDEF domain-containing protein [Ruminococcus sp.]